MTRRQATCVGSSPTRGYGIPTNLDQLRTVRDAQIEEAQAAIAPVEPAKGTRRQSGPAPPRPFRGGGTIEWPAVDRGCGVRLRARWMLGIAHSRRKGARMWRPLATPGRVASLGRLQTRMQTWPPTAAEKW